MSASDEIFHHNIMKHDQIKIWQKKLNMLKKGLLDERDNKQEMIKQKQERTGRIEMLNGEIEWKNRQNENLNKEIKAIKDEILENRNKKRKLREELLHLQNMNNSSGSDQTRTADH